MKNQPRQLTHVRAAIYGRPLAISEEGYTDICAIIEAHADGLDVPTIEPRQHRNQMRASLSAMFGEEVLADERAPYESVNGCALIPISGPLLATAPAAMFRNISNVTSYGEIVNAFDAAVSDESIDTIVPVFFSPGGECMKCFDVCEAVHSIAMDSKQVVGLIDGLCASAAYAIASQCVDLYCTPHSRVGSIGIIGGIRDTSRAEKNAGVDTIVIRSGELKGIGEGPVTPDQIQSVKAEMNSLFGTFKAIVQRGRPGIDIEAASTGETWYATDATRATALDMHLVDGIRTLRDIVENKT